MKRVTADSNVWVSALIWGGKPLRLLEQALQGEIDLAISPAIVSETLRVFREKFDMQPDDLAKAEPSCAHARGSSSRPNRWTS